MLTKLTRGNQITIPRPIIEKAHLKSGVDYLQVEYIGGVIYLKPVEVEERIAPEIFEKFQKQVLKKEKGDMHVSEREADEFLSKRIRSKK